MAFRHRIGNAAEEGRQAAVKHRAHFLGDAIGKGEGQGKTSGLREVGKADRHIPPGLRRRQRDAHAGDDARGAIGAIDRIGRIALDIENARRVLQRGHAHTQQIAPLAHRAMAHAAHPGAAAGHEAANGGGALGAGPDPQFPAALARPEIEVDHLRPGLGLQHAIGQRNRRRHGGEVEHQPTLQRHALAVIAGGAAAGGDGHAHRPAFTQDVQHLILIARPRPEISTLAVQLAFQNRRVPIEIPRFLSEQRPVAGMLDAFKLHIGHAG